MRVYGTLCSKVKIRRLMQTQSNPSDSCKSGACDVAELSSHSNSLRRSLPALWLGQPAVVPTERSTLAHAAIETVQEPLVTQSSES